MKYKVNFYKFIKILLPPFLRKERQMAWLYTLLKPLVQDHNTFISYREKTIDELKHNGQTYKLEHLLNMKFDTAYKQEFLANKEAFAIRKNNKIYIKDNLSSAAGNEFFLYMGDETNEQNKKNFHSKNEALEQQLFLREEFMVEGMEDFIVVYSPELIEDKDSIKLGRLKALVQKYKLAGLQFKAIST